MGRLVPDGQAWRAGAKENKRAPESLAGGIAEARLYSSEDNFDGAIKEIKAAQWLPGVSEAPVTALDPALKRLENHEDIN